MNHDELSLRRHLRRYFDLEKTAAERHSLISELRGDETPPEERCRVWYEDFRNDDFDGSDEECPERSKKFKDVELRELLEENPVQTLSELSRALNVTPLAVSRRLRAMGRIYKDGTWLPHKLPANAIVNRLSVATSLLARYEKRDFLWRIVTGDETWIYFNNPKWRKPWADPSQPFTSTPKKSIHESKSLLCIWWDMMGVLYYELLRPNEIVTADRYQQQLRRLNDKVLQTRVFLARNMRKVILLHNARPCVARSMKETLLQLEWELLPHPAYSPDLAPSNYHLFPSMQRALTDTHFSSYEEVKNWVDEWITSKCHAFYYHGIALLLEKWRKVVENGGDYFD